MTLLNKIRLGAAIALLCAMFLPLSECSGRTPKQAPAPPAKPLMRQLVSGCDNAADCKVVAKELTLSWEGALQLLTFTWPFIFLPLAAKWAGRRFTWIMHLLELLLCAGTLYMLWGITLFDEARYGTTVVLAAVLTYGISAIIYLVRAIRAALRRRRALRQARGASAAA
jgi:hypothetical protein